MPWEAKIDVAQYYTYYIKLPAFCDATLDYTISGLA
jgi:hypothetical protein